MQVIRKNLWDCDGPLAVTTNGYVKTNRHAVMGAGVAKEATELIPGLSRSLGIMIGSNGNIVQRIAGPDHPQCKYEKDILSFPVKDHWNDKASLELIEQSARQLRDFFRVYIDVLYLPKPGCGNGRLKWKDVEPVLDEHIGDLNVIIVDR